MSTRIRDCPKCGAEEVLTFEGDGEWMSLTEIGCECSFNKPETDAIEMDMTVTVREAIALARAESAVDYYEQHGGQTESEEA